MTGTAIAGSLVKSADNGGIGAFLPFSLSHVKITAHWSPPVAVIGNTDAIRWEKSRRCPLSLAQHDAARCVKARNTRSSRFVSAKSLAFGDGARWLRRLA